MPRTHAVSVHFAAQEGEALQCRLRQLDETAWESFDRIDPRNYGVKNFPALFAATGLFQIVKTENGQSYVADKRNKDRTAQPSR